MSDFIMSLLGRILQPAMEVSCADNIIRTYFKDGEVVRYQLLYEALSQCTQTPDLLAKYLAKEGIIIPVQGQEGVFIIRIKKTNLFK